jgi:hypothetical protein
MAAHIDTCPHCRRETAALSAFFENFPKSEPLPPAGFFARQKTAILDRLESSPVFSAGRLWRWAPGLAVLSLLAAWVIHTTRAPRLPVSSGLVENLEMVERLDLLETWAEMDAKTKS